MVPGKLGLVETNVNVLVGSTLAVGFFGATASPAVALPLPITSICAGSNFIAGREHDPQPFSIRKRGGLASNHVVASDTHGAKGVGGSGIVAKMRPCIDLRARPSRRAASSMDFRADCKMRG